jgi:ABC-type transporter Mla subunit MlaD
VSLLAQDERLTRRIGTVVLVVIGAAILFVVFLLDRIEIGSYTRVHVFFHQTGGLREGAPVVIAGRSIGRIESIAPSLRGAPTPLGGDEGVDVTVAIESRHIDGLRHGADVFVASKGPLADRYLEIGPTPESGAPLADGQPVLGRDPPTLDRVLQRTWENLTTVGSFLDEVRPEAQALRKQLDVLGQRFADVQPTLENTGTLGAEVDALMAEARSTWNQGLGGRAGIDRIGELVTHTRTTLADIRGMLDQLGAKATTLRASASALGARMDAKLPAAVAAVELAIDRIRAAIDKVDPLLANIAELNKRLANNEGSIGRLMNDPEFPEDAKELGKILKRQPWKVIAHPPN